MDPDTLSFLTDITAIFSALFAVMATSFLFWGYYQDERHENTRDWFRATWEAIVNSTWMVLPERAIRWILEAKERAAARLTDAVSEAESAMSSIGLGLLICIWVWFHWGILWSLIAALAYVIITLGIAFLLIKLSMVSLFKIRLTFRQRLAVYTAHALHYSFSIIPSVLAVVLWMWLISTVSLTLATVLVFVSLPFLSAVIVYPIQVIADEVLSYDQFIRRQRLINTKVEPGGWANFERQSKELAESIVEEQIILHRLYLLLIIFLIGGHAGVAFTYLAMLLGHGMDPGAFVPRTWSVLVVNFICDGVTLAATFAILKRAASSGRLLAMPAAFLKIIAIAIGLAFLSAYAGLLFSPRPLSVIETLNILIARSPDGSRFELSPTFWVMHTTFIPVLLYLIAIQLFWFAKLFLTAIRWYFGKGAGMRNPLNLTGGFFGVLMAIFALVATVFGIWHKHAERRQKELNRPEATISRLQR